jgi:hypothetical protein
MLSKLNKCGKGCVGESEEGKKDKTTPDVGGKSLSEKSQSTCTSKNPFEKSSSKQTAYFVLLFKDKSLLTYFCFQNQILSH